MSSAREAAASLRRLLKAAQGRAPVDRLFDFISLAGSGGVEDGSVQGEGGAKDVWEWDTLAPPAVGIDVEWRPVRRKGQRERVAILQIAFVYSGEEDGGERDEGRGAIGQVHEVLILDVLKISEALAGGGEGGGGDGWDMLGEGVEEEIGVSSPDVDEGLSAESVAGGGANSISGDGASLVTGDSRRGEERGSAVVEGLTMVEEEETEKLALAVTEMLSVLKDVMGREGVVKVGFQVRDDLKKAANANAALGAALRPVTSLVDLSSWHAAHQVRSGPKISLAGLVDKYMQGAVLNKDACLSNWEARPLSEKQLKYAALDAAVLLPLFLRLHFALPVTYTAVISSFSANK